MSIVSVNIMGGLGNQLFQIFTTISYAIKGKNKEELFNNLKESTKSKIIKKIGFTVVLKYEKH